jgi:hypothetical protein
MMISFEELLILDNFDIDVYPNKLIEKRYNVFLSLLEENNLKTHRINLLPEGGVCFIFKKNNFTIYFEIYNNGEMGYIIEDSINHKMIDNQDIKNFNDLIKIFKNE